MSEEQPRGLPDPAASPRLAVRVGITGHRSLDAGAVPLVERSMAQVLDEVQAAAIAVAGAARSGYDASAPLLRAVSPLAEGADRMLAHAALGRGWDLQCPLPFAREEYERDFASDESRAEFRRLLARASSVFECDGNRGDPEAYQAMAVVLLNQVDVLVAVWDGKPGNGPGGTADVVADAERRHVPVVWIDARDASIQVRDIDRHEGGRAPWPKQLRTILERTLCIGGSMDPAARSREDEEERALFEDSIRIPRSHASPLGTVFRHFSKALAWPGRAAAVPSEVSEPAAAIARPPNPFDAHYQRANDAAVHYAGVDRGGILVNYLLGAVAVLCALATIPLGRAEPPAPPWVITALTAAELLALISMAFLYFTARIRMPKRRALSCRLYAEQFRQMEFLWPLGRNTPESRPMAHQSFGDPRGTAMSWRFRAAVREIGLANVRLDEAMLRGALARIRGEWIGGAEGQVAYHRAVAGRIERQDHRLHAFAWAMFAATFACCVGHFLAHGNRTLELWLTVGCAGLPALGAAAHAVTSQFEFRRLRERSVCMERNLSEALAGLRALTSDGSRLSSRSIAEAIYPASRAMMDEVVEWRILSSKPPSEPA